MFAVQHRCVFTAYLSEISAQCFVVAVVAERTVEIDTLNVVALLIAQSFEVALQALVFIAVSAQVYLVVDIATAQQCTFS